MKLSTLSLKSLSLDELWDLHEKVRFLLSEKITAEKRALDDRLAKLNRSMTSEKAVTKQAALKGSKRRTASRKYPPVLPKYQNPGEPSETWAGRGKQPRWMVAQIKAGKKISDFLIDGGKRQASAKPRRT
jgi:DNA-binding protein H-NS